MTSLRWCNIFINVCELLQSIFIAFMRRKTFLDHNFQLVVGLSKSSGRTRAERTEKHSLKSNFEIGLFIQKFMH